MLDINPGWCPHDGETERIPDSNLWKCTQCNQIITHRKQPKKPINGCLHDCPAEKLPDSKRWKCSQCNHVFDQPDYWQ